MGFDAVTREIEEQRRALEEKLAQERRTAQEIEIARQVQAKLFPQALPEISTLEYAGVCVQARQVGGDYFDFLEFGGGRFGIVIADIAGKGIAAALLMANLQANLRIHCAMALDDPRRLLRSVNHVFHKNTIDGAYATLFFAEYEDAANRLRYANCGHLPGLILRTGGVLERLHSTALPVGLFREWDCVVEHCTLSAGDILALYSDGITERFNAAGEEFGEERLIESLRRHRDLCPQALIPAVIADVEEYGGEEQGDDVTLIIARRRSL